MLRRTILGIAAGTAAALAARSTRAQAEPDAAVDVLLVLAVDVSRSIDEDEARLQREGHRDALTHPMVMEAVQGGMVGAVGLAYVEWSGAEQQRLVLPWTRIASRADAEDWAAALGRAPRASLGQTSVSGAIDFSRRVLGEAPWQAARRVIDVSGDGVNNSGPPAEGARDRAVAEGVTVNGLAIVNDRPTFGRVPLAPLDEYYRESVIGGPGAFLIVVEEFESFGVAVRRKLVREISDLPPPRRTARADAASEGSTDEPDGEGE